MIYAEETMDLLKNCRWKAFRTHEITRFVESRQYGPIDRKRKKAIRNGVLRVLDALQELGTITRKPPRGAGSYATYQWKVPHEVGADCHENRHNLPRAIAP